jgi:hypothetical protein
MKLMKFFGLLIAVFALAILPTQSFPSTQAAPATGQQNPTPYVMDGGAGPCSAEFTVTGPDGKPVFAALINVHVVYGFGGFHKLDLGVYTDHDGKAKFTGLPAKVRNPPLEFRAGKDNLAGMATVDPATECQARHDIILEAPKK